MRYLFISSVLIALGILLFITNRDQATKVPDPNPQGTAPLEADAVYTNTPGS